MTLFHSPSVQSPAAYSNINLQGAQLATRMAATASVAQRASLRTAWQDVGSLFQIHASESNAGLVDANIGYGFEVGNVLRYGADPTGAADSTLAFTRAYNVATAAAGFLQIDIPAGTYKIAGSTVDALGVVTCGLLWNAANLHVRARGDVTLNFTTASLGHLIAIDAGNANKYGVTVHGWPKLVGNATTTDAWFVRGFHHSYFELRAGDCLVGCKVNFAVCSYFRNFRCSVNEAAFAAQTPAVGLWFDQRSAGETASFCIADNPICEGITSVNGQGILLASTLGCQIRGGTSEANKIGLAVSGANNSKNVVIGTDFESNTNNDIVLAGGLDITFEDINSGSNATANPNIDMQVAIPGLLFRGCFLRWVNMQSDHATFIGCKFSNGGSVGLKSNGHAYKAFGCIQIDGAGNWTADQADQLGESGVFTPTIFGVTTAGAQTYAKQKGYWQRVGKVVHFTCVIQLTANAGGVGTARISFNGGAAPPPASRNQTDCTHSFAVCNYVAVTLGAAGRQLSATMAAAGLTLDLLESDTGSVSNPIAITAIGAAAIINFSGSYLID